MKKIIFLVLLSAQLITCPSCLQTSTPDKGHTNLIFFLVDDQRNDVLGCYGHPFIKTPNIDELAEKGTRFTHSFVTTSICMASRATIMTGLHSRTNGVHYYQTPLDSSFVQETYPVLMKEAGISTGFIGKFGYKVAGNKQPEEWFDYYKPLGRNPYFKTLEDGTKRHETELAGDYAIEFLNQQKQEKPFCLSVSFNSVHAEDGDKRPGSGHYPWPKAVDDMYENISVPEPALSSPEFYENLPGFLKNSLNRQRYFWRWDSPEKYQTNMKAYFRMISGVDKVIGRVIGELKKLGLSDNTIIIYSADNGYYMGDRGLAGKWSHFDQSLRVPLIIYNPGIENQKVQKVCDKLCLNLDLPPTFLECMNIPVPEKYQGKSLLPLIQNNIQTQWRTRFFCEFTYHNPIIPTWEGIRTENYMYADYKNQNAVFLYDLNTDPDQKTNVISNPDYAEKKKELEEFCHQKANEYEK